MNSFDYFFEHTYKLEKNFVLGPKETISYVDLYNRSIKLATYLRSTIGENNNILLIALNSVFFITVYLAILKSGNVVVPLNPEIEQSNLNFIQDKCQANLTFTTAQLTTKLNFRNSSILDEKALDSLLHTEPNTSPTKPTTHNLQPTTYSLQPTAYSLFFTFFPVAVIVILSFNSMICGIL